jgi:hypothetical protein
LAVYVVLCILLWPRRNQDFYHGLFYILTFGGMWFFLVCKSIVARRETVRLSKQFRHEGIQIIGIAASPRLLPFTNGVLLGFCLGANQKAVVKFMYAWLPTLRRSCVYRSMLNSHY